MMFETHDIFIVIYTWEFCRVDGYRWLRIKKGSGTWVDKRESALGSVVNESVENQLPFLIASRLLWLLFLFCQDDPRVPRKGI